MPLSEHEQRQLEQIEKALYADYPKLAQSVRAKDPRVHYRRRAFGAGLAFLVGVGLLLGGVVTQIIPVGVGGFVVMLAAAMLALVSWRHMSTGHIGRGQGGGRGAGGTRHRPRGRGRRQPRMTRQGFMERLEDRWRRRQERGR